MESCGHTYTLPSFFDVVDPVLFLVSAHPMFTFIWSNFSLLAGIDLMLLFSTLLPLL